MAAPDTLTDEEFAAFSAGAPKPEAPRTQPAVTAAPDTLTDEEFQALGGLEPQPFGQSVLHGLVESAGDVAGALGFVGDALRGPDRSPAAVKATLQAMREAGAPTSRDELEALRNPTGEPRGKFEAVMSAMSEPRTPMPTRVDAMQNPTGAALGAPVEGMRQFFKDPARQDEAFSYRDPITTSEKAWSGVGRGLGYAPFAASGGPAAVGGEMIGTVAGPFVGEYTTAALTPEGEKPGAAAILTGVGAELATSLVSPLAFSKAVGSKGPKAALRIKQMRANQLAKNATPEAQELLSDLQKQSDQLWRAMYPEAGGKPPQFDLSDLFDVVKKKKGAIPIDLEGKVDYRMLLADMMDESLAINPDLKLRPSQVGEPQGVLREVSKRQEEALLRMEGADPFANIIGGQQAGLESDLRARFTKMLRSGSPQQFATGAQKHIDDVGDAARASWDEIPFEDMGEVDFTIMEQKAQELIADSRLAEEYVPDLVTRIAKGGAETEGLDMKAVQNARSVLGAVVADGTESGAKAIEASKAADFRASLDAMIDDLMDAGVEGSQNAANLAKWKKGRADWAAYRDLTDFERVSGGDMARLLTSKNPAANVGKTAISSPGDAQRALRFAEGNPETLDSLKRSVQLHLLGTPRPNSVTGFSKKPNAIRDAIERGREGAVAILGEDAVRHMETAVDTMEQAAATRVGKRGFESSTGSGGKGMMDAVRAAVTRSKTDAAINLTEAMLDGVKTTDDQVLLLQLLHMDRKLLADSMRLSTDVDLPEFMLRLQRAQNIAQSQVRAPSVAARAIEKMQEDKQKEQEPTP